MREGISTEEWDAAKRMADAVNVHVAASLAAGRPFAGFVAIKLSDGSAADGVLYESRKEAFRHHPHEQYLFAVKVGADSMPASEALIVLQMARRAFKKGVRFSEEEPVALQLGELNSPLLPRTMAAIKKLHLPKGYQR